MSEVAVIYKNAATLKPRAKNSRTHSAEQVSQIAASIKEFGFTNPVLIDPAGGVIAGHGRLEAAKLLGMADVPTITLDGLSPAQIRAYVIADNKLALNAGWDLDILRLELGELGNEGFDLSLIGFGDDELAVILADKTEGLTDPDAVPDVPENPVTKPGDVWLLGKHRLMCGDSTSIDAVDKLMAGQRADLCFTSPPYAQQRAYKQEISDWDALMDGVFGVLPVKDGAQVLVNLGLVHEKGRVNAYWDAWLGFMDSAGWPLFGWYVWDQGFGLPGNWNGRLAPSHEFVFHFSKGGNKSANKWVDKKEENIKSRSVGASTMRGKDGKTKKFTNPGASGQPTKVADSVIRINRQVGRVTKDGDHPAVFPVALCDHIYESYAKAGDWMYEPFSGSGTSIIACEEFGMCCAAMELAPAYVDVAVKRWQDFTGEQATLEGSGEIFPTIKADAA